MKDVTSDEVKAAVLASGKKWIELRRCSICDSPVGYVIQGDELLFDPSCDCCGGYGPEPRSWSTVSDLINRQNDEWKPKLAALFGVEVSP
jgi:hypothetical protein